MSWLMESPVTIIGAVVLTEFTLAAALFTTGQVRILGGMLLVAVLGLGLLFTERMVVTDGEAIRSTLDAAAHSLMTNDPGKVLGYVDPSAEQLRERTKGIFNRVTFKEAHVGGDYELVLHADQSPPTATASFFARATVQEKSGNSLLGREEMPPIPVIVDLRKIDGRWLIVDAHDKERRF